MARPCVEGYRIVCRSLRLGRSRHTGTRNRISGARALDGSRSVPPAPVNRDNTPALAWMDCRLKSAKRANMMPSYKLPVARPASAAAIETVPLFEEKRIKCDRRRAANRHCHTAEAVEHHAGSRRKKGNAEHMAHFMEQNRDDTDGHPDALSGRVTIGVEEEQRYPDETFTRTGAPNSRKRHWPGSFCGQSPIVVTGASRLYGLAAARSQLVEC